MQNSINSDPRFQQYLKLLLKWNKAYNLTAITSPEGIALKHFEDSLRLVPYLPKKGALLDAGTGAGFPGIPLAIALPHLAVTLLDSRSKKTIFCEAAVRELRLPNVRVVCGRLEETDIHNFDLVVSRATFKAKEFFEMVFPRLKMGAKAILMKGPEWKKETPSPFPLPSREGVRGRGAIKPVFSNISYSLSDGSQRALLVVEQTGSFASS